MSRLHEFQGKALLRQFGIRTPVGGVAETPQAARALAADIGGPVVVKAQIWMTGRAGAGGIRFAAGPVEAERAATALLGTTIGHFTVEQLLVEERLHGELELFAAIVIDDRARAPVMIFSREGGSGIEEIAGARSGAVARQVIDIRSGFDPRQAHDLVGRTGLRGELAIELSALLPRMYQLARHYDARAVEINPLMVTVDGELVAADCRLTIDDYAVYRHPKLAIEVAREFDHPATPLEKVAWAVERKDYRGTFYFVELRRQPPAGGRVLGFHGSGGGGSMLSMDALLDRDLNFANFADTSGNPPASKVYRAARIILGQRGIAGYFASGSGVASQEQFHSARGLAKAFLEAPLTVPAVIRLGGNGEEYALEILRQTREHLQVPLEGYAKDDTVEFCAERMRDLIESFEPPSGPVRKRETGVASKPYRFETVSGGTVTLDHAACLECRSKICIDTCAPQILELEDEVPVLKIGLEEARRGGCTECLACDVSCYLEGNGGGLVSLPIEGLEVAAS